MLGLRAGRVLRVGGVGARGVPRARVGDVDWGMQPLRDLSRRQAGANEIGHLEFAIAQRGDR